MNPPNSEPIGRTSLSMNDAIEQGIEAARAGNRLLARWQLESVAVGNDVRPEVWLWLAWVADSPVKAQAYLKNVLNDPRHGRSAFGGLEWISFLTGEPLPPAPAAAIPAQSRAVDPQSSPQPAEHPDANALPPLQSNESVVHCPGCESILYVRSSAFGRPRVCPACHGTFLVNLNPIGQVQVHLLLRGPDEVPASGEVPATDKDFISSAPTQSVPQSHPNETILVVDDSATIRRMASMILIDNGYKVLTAENGEQGFAIAQMDLPNLILLDINMPGIGGYETCKMLRANQSTRHIPIVILSSNDGLFDQVKAFQAGSSKYLTKPCDAEAILATVRQFLTRPISAKS